MSDEANNALRVAVITALAKRLAADGMGRTALMKFAYFLQSLKGVPLNYTFRLYNYGPYESQVLEDLKISEVMRAVRSTAFSYPWGSGYRITPGDHADDIIDRNRKGLAEYEEALDWVVNEFGSRSAIDLEMASTIVYVDRASAAAHEELPIPRIADRVAEIKPRLDRAKIEVEAKALAKKGLLIATS